MLGDFPSFGEAVWSAIAHLVDPGSIGDDETGGKRAIGLIQVISGIIFFAGIVLTVLTEVLDRALRRLQKGDPAITREGHLLIIGFNDSLSEVRELVAETFTTDFPDIVVMLPVDQMGSRDAARRALAGYPAKTNVVVADPETDGFDRVCAGAARHIVLLSPEGEADAADLTVTGRAALLAEHLEPFGSEAPAVGFELRRWRNVNALWYEAAPAGAARRRRFPASFDALVNDRNLGALLSLAVANPVFAETFLDGSGATAPQMIPAGPCGGLTFDEARDALPEWILLGVLSGTGPAAVARYLPEGRHRIGATDRLIVLEATAGSRGPGRLADLASVKVTPTRPGPLLMIGWTDASRALIEVLETTGFDAGRIHLLNPEPPSGYNGRGDERRLSLIEGDPAEPADIHHAIERVEPGIIHVAATDGNEPGALISAIQARQAGDVPVMVEQYSTGAGGEALRITDGLTVVSTARLLAETVAISLDDPAVLAAREQMFSDPGVVLESLTYMGREPLPVADLPAIFERASSVPLAVSLGGDDQTELHPGDHILALRRVEPAA